MIIVGMAMAFSTGKSLLRSQGYKRYLELHDKSGSLVVFIHLSSNRF